MRRPTIEEMRYMTKEGRAIFDEYMPYAIAKNDYEFSKLVNKGNGDPTEPIKPKISLVGNEEIIIELKFQYGIKISSIAKLNSIFAEMGFIEKILKKWYLTEKGKEYSIFAIRITPPNIWTDEILPVLADYLKNN